MALKIIHITAQDKTTGETVELDATALAHIGLSSKGNVEVTTDLGQKLNIETGDNIALKPNGNLQLDTDHYTTATDKDEFKLKTICADKNSVVGMNIESAGLKFLTKAASTLFGWDPEEFKLKFQKTKDTWAKLKLSAASIDLRCRTTGQGTGGGIAAQISSCDSDYNENKFKIETDRIAPISQGQATASTYDQTYSGEGGKGIEIFTMNSLHMSAWAGDYRFNADAKIYPCHRGDLVTDPVTGKVDFPTQADDFKDIKPADGITWEDIYVAVKYIRGTVSDADLARFQPAYRAQ